MLFKDSSTFLISNLQIQFSDGFIQEYLIIIEKQQVIEESQYNGEKIRPILADLIDKKKI